MAALFKVKHLYVTGWSHPAADDGRYMYIKPATNSFAQCTTTELRVKPCALWHVRAHAKVIWNWRTKEILCTFSKSLRFQITPVHYHLYPYPQTVLLSHSLMCWTFPYQHGLRSHFQYNCVLSESVIKEWLVLFWKIGASHHNLIQDQVLLTGSIGTF